MTGGHATIELHGERLHLLAERAAWWERTGTLLVADPHFGKAAAFRAAGVPVPPGTTGGTLQRLGTLLDRLHARRLVVLGDLLHARAGRDPRMLQALTDWRTARPAVEMVLVRGNHDRHAGDPPDELRMRCVDEPLAEPPFVLRHVPEPAADGYVIAGHLHPGARLAGAGRDRARLPCFWMGARVGVLPAFGEFTGLADVMPQPGDRVFVVGNDVVEIAPR